MRFVSMYPQLSLGTVIKEKFVLALDGQRDQTVESVSVRFSQTNLVQDDIDFALSVFPEKSFRGRYLEEDHITQEPLAGRIGVFDSDLEAERLGWSDEIKEKVEAWMLKHPGLGKEFAEMVPVVREITKPWPSYNSTHHFKVAQLAAELGLLEEALAYEQANKARKGVIEALEEQLQIHPKPPAEDEEVVAA